MLAAAAARASRGDRARAGEWLRSLGAARPAFQGVSGAISFTTRPRTRMRMARIENGRAVAVEPR
jgi:hypothetical protein